MGCERSLCKSKRNVPVQLLFRLDVLTEYALIIKDRSNANVELAGKGGFAMKTLETEPQVPSRRHPQLQKKIAISSRFCLDNFSSKDKPNEINYTESNE